ncbi:hypothetical protein GFJ39_12675 [Gluconobacter sp. AC10]|uniref:Syntaxin-5 N-terminal Sly1p-binding domain-containing protein n=1 Tax=Gluconobacter aidae TaxID=2662454 RepID=A0A7X1SRT2_9PROT|nr:hypothetical protein [Gluconobacter aidae]
MFSRLNKLAEIATPCRFWWKSGFANRYTVRHRTAEFQSCLTQCETIHA